ncbi:MAG: HNH endonuclease family protein, partial [Chthoniobacterales bacterium]
TTLVLESVNRRLSEGSGGYTVLDARPTIEHVMPQTLNDQWKEDLGIQWEQTHRDYLHTIGNLTLVTSEWNASLSNAPFAIKKPKLASHALRINNSYFSREIACWNRDGIRERADDVGETILQIWPSFLPSDIEHPDTLRVNERPAASEFDEAAVERIAVKLGTSLRRLSQARFESDDGTMRVVGLCSKGYRRGTDAVRYWYGIKPSQNDFLQLATNSWIAFECESPEKVVLLEFSFLQPLLKKLQETEGKHWHVEIFERAGQFEIDLPVTSETVSVTDRVLGR